MYYAVIHRPKAETANLDKIREEYDPSFGLIGPHVTLVFPVSAADISESALRAHVETIAHATKPFTATLDQVAEELSWDQWLFLEPAAGHGREEYDALHDTLYGGPLQPFLRTDLPYAPHIGLGHFAADSSYRLKNPEASPVNHERYEAARQDIERLSGLTYTFPVDELEIVTINDDFTKSETLVRIPLQG